MIPKINRSFIDSEHYSIKYCQPATERFSKWATNHREAAKALLVALAILFSPILAPIFIVAAPVLFFKGIAGGYTGCETLNKIGRLCGTFVDFLAPAKHDM